MSNPDKFHASLADLYLCPDCHHVSNSSTVCHGCSNTANLMNLSQLLNRSEVIENG